MSNKDTYEKNTVVHYYVIADQLQKPEQTILNILKDNLKNMKMLDIGVGGGRTTIHFAKLVKEYVGVDYAKNMIAACKKRFPVTKNISFKVADARKLTDFDDNSFDFVLFSFNGLDYISHYDRIEALKEIKRVLKNGGIFVFSSHNLNAISLRYFFMFSFHPLRLTRNILFWFLVFLKRSVKKYKMNEWVIINDGALDLGLTTYYIKPIAQIQQLKELGFKNIQRYSIKSGEEIKPSDLYEVDDAWIYYLSNI
jgi:ubiquinone/menaquinone biosynthesis C-methylase UbiE